MARECQVCAHPDVFTINEQLVGVGGKRSNRSIAHQYSLHHSAVQRHREHIPQLLVKAAEAEEVAQADNLLAEVRDLQRRTLAILDAAEGDGADERKTALAAIREARENLRLLGNLAGELQGGVNINLTLSPQWIELRTILLGALDSHPEAKATVVEALEEATQGRPSAA